MKTSGIPLASLTALTALAVLALLACAPAPTSPRPGRALGEPMPSASTSAEPLWLRSPLGCSADASLTLFCGGTSGRAHQEAL